MVSMERRYAMENFWLFFVFLLAVFGSVAESQVVIKDCPGNVYSKTGEAAWTIPRAEVTDTDGQTTPLEIKCDHPAESTLYTEYKTKVVCTASDAEGNMATCSFYIFLPEGVTCSKKGGTPHCTCLDYRPFFDPCQCDDGYSGMDCQVHDGSGCSGTSSDPASCDCNGGSCGCASGYKGQMCEIDFQPPDITCPMDVFTANATHVLPPPDSVSATDNSEQAVDVECNPPLGSMVIGTGNTTVVTVACSARDTAGNRADCSFRAVLDNEPPKIPYCPGSVHTNDSNYEWPLDIAVDNSHDHLNVTCSPEPGAQLTGYKTEVMCTVQDAAGNTAEDSCTFSIFRDGGSCSPSDANCMCEAGSCWCIEGYSGITCSVEDGSGCVASGDPGPGCMCNSSSDCECQDGFKGAACEIDFQPPEMSNCPFGEIWSYTPVVTYRPIWISDNNDTVKPVAEVTCYPAEGSEFYEYSTDVTCSAADPSGNKVADCEFPVRRNSASDCTEDDGFCYNCDSRCRCIPGYYGPTCKVCGGCVNGGTRDEDQCQCECPTLHHGLICNECYEPNADHCFNDGIFVFDTCSCECPGDWTGKHCNQKHAEGCLNSTNANQEGCLCTGDVCSCKDNFQGPNCETCRPCENGGTIQDSETCICECPGFYQAPLCSECDVNAVCQNNGTFDETSCSCKCVSGWMGKDCSDAGTFSSSCWSDIIKPLDQGKTTAVVTWSDAADPGTVMECSPSSGSVFTRGTTVVQCTSSYTDTGSSSSCSFSIFVDDRAPLVTCPNDISMYHQRWKTTSQMGWAGATAQDEVSGTVPVTCIPPSNSVFSGETTVVCSAFDDAMNMGFCTFTVEVGYRESTLSFPTTMSCAKCYKDNPEGSCSYDPDEDEYSCYCPSGFAVDKDGICQDIDECEDAKNLCDSNAECLNTDGSYQCQCNDGFSGSGSVCREYPYTMYPDIPNLPTDNTPEKKIAVDVAVSADSMYGCYPQQDPMSKECSILINTFTRLVREMYIDFSPALLRIEMDQSALKSGRVPHVAVYDYTRLSATQRATSAQTFYNDTVGSSVKSGKMGGLKLEGSCASCDPPMDLTDLCGVSPKPECEDGFILQEMRPDDDAACYLTCESLCSTDYCGAGMCIHNPPYEPKCRCPSDTVGPRCDPLTTTEDGDPDAGEVDQLNLPVIIGCSVAGGVLLLLILAVVAYLLQSNRKKAAKKAYLEKEGKTNESFVMEKRQH